MIDFYTNPQSRGAIVRWMLEELGQPYRTHLLDYGTTMKAPAYLAINPMGKVPAIVHDGRVVTEGAAICAYLADTFPDAGLAPPPGQRDQYYRWLFFGAGPFEAAMVDLRLGLRVTPEQHRMTGYGCLDHVVDALDLRLQASPFLAGEHFSAADVYTGSMLSYGVMFGAYPARQAFTDYTARLDARPARLRAAKLDEEAGG